MKSSNPWRFRLRLQIINGKRNLIVDGWREIGVCLKLQKKDYNFLKTVRIRELKPINIELRKT